eukprot:2326818-Amphidinium_carterae.1
MRKHAPDSCSLGISEPRSVSVFHPTQNDVSNDQKLNIKPLVRFSIVLWQSTARTQRHTVALT